KIEGRVLSLSPLVVLFSVAFWGWVWGIFGAFLAVPLTMAIVVSCQQFDTTRWVAALLSDIDESEKRSRSGAEGENLEYS
ncbi:MAG: AI-2E family transporter, partial [Gemmatimonadaceae bacterium]|nr:AI-2E family transporter [Gemmatimonadaceae bacterium]